MGRCTLHVTLSDAIVFKFTIIFAVCLYSVPHKKIPDILNKLLNFQTFGKRWLIFTERELAMLSPDRLSSVVCLQRSCAGRGAHSAPQSAPSNLLAGFRGKGPQGWEGEGRRWYSGRKKATGMKVTLSRRMQVSARAVRDGAPSGCCVHLLIHVAPSSVSH